MPYDPEIVELGRRYISVENRIKLLFWIGFAFPPAWFAAIAADKELKVIQQRVINKGYYVNLWLLWIRSIQPSRYSRSSSRLEGMPRSPSARVYIHAKKPASRAYPALCAPKERTGQTSLNGSKRQQ